MTFVTKPPQKGANITLGELLDGLFQYLDHLGITVGRYEFEASPADGWGYPAATGIRLYNISESGVLWSSHRYIFFDLEGKACRVLTSRIGSGPFELFLVATRASNISGEEFRVVADIEARPLRDKSLEVTPRDPPRKYEPLAL